MSTRCYIGKETGPNRYKAVYCVHDGYLDHAGKILYECYNTPERVDRLLALGEIDILWEKLPDDANGQEKVTRRFDDARPAEVRTIEELEAAVSDDFAADYVYLFTREGKWIYYGGNKSQMQWSELGGTLQSGVYGNQNSKALNEYALRLKNRTDGVVAHALELQCKGRYAFKINENAEIGNPSQETSLLLQLLKERREIGSAEFLGGYLRITLAEEYRKNSEEEYRSLSEKEFEVMCAKHVLWLNDAGGEQADFSHCLLADMDLRSKNLINTVFDGAKFYNVKLPNDKLSFSTFQGAKLYFCEAEDFYAKNSDFKNAVFYDCEFENAYFENCNFTKARCYNCGIGFTLDVCCIEDADFGIDSEEIDCIDCDGDERQWRVKVNGGNIEIE